jgi:GMP synthase (glutamine-hydrolysing)
MHFHLLQHVDFEGPAAIQDWVSRQGYTLTKTRFFLDEQLPALTDFDILIVMGGPMGVDDHQQYPWLNDERAFIQQAIAGDKVVLGICLGAQLIACATGAKVTKNRYTEIGWFPVTTRQHIPALLAGVFPPEFLAFHWHGDTFGMPQGAIPVASSEVCSNQAFVLNERVIGLQFHIETTPESAALLVQNCSDELDGSRYVQSAEMILTDTKKFRYINQLLDRLLENMVKLALSGSKNK